MYLLCCHWLKQTVSSAQHFVGVAFVQMSRHLTYFKKCSDFYLFFTQLQTFVRNVKLAMFAWLWLKQTVAPARHLVRNALGGSALALTDFTRQERLAWLPYNFSTHRLHWLLKLALLSELWPKQTVALRAATLYGTIPASGRQMNFHGLAASASASATYWVLLTNYCH